MAILVVDDDEVMLTLIETFLRRRGYAVAKATSALTALALLDTMTPELFILDFMMPVTNGLELCKQLRSRLHSANIPILMFSARSDHEIVQACFDAGASAYLSKSELPKLYSVVRELLEKNTSTHETFWRAAPSY